MRVLYYGNEIWCNSGYGRCAHKITYGLAIAGHEVGLQTNFGLLGGILNDGTVLHYPQGGGFSEAELFANYSIDKWDIVIAQYDIWALDSIPQRIRDTNAIFCPYVPIDHEFITPRLKPKLDASFEIVAMCKYGERLLRESGYNNVRTIYHGVDTNIYKPLEDYDKATARTLLGFKEDDFVIGMVQMNRSGRKDIPRQLEAVKMFADNNPDVNVRVYLHTHATQPDGDNLNEIIKHLGLEDKVRLPNERMYLLGFSDQEMAKVYQGSDVLLHASPSEGFGMPVIESFACGTNVIATDSTSMTELLEPTPEFMVKISDWTWAGQIPAKVKIVDRNDIAEKLNKALNSDLKSYEKKLHEHCVKTFDWQNVIIPQWVKFVEDVEIKIEQTCVRVPKIPTM